MSTPGRGLVALAYLLACLAVAQPWACVEVRGSGDALAPDSDGDESGDRPADIGESSSASADDLAPQLDVGDSGSTECIECSLTIASKQSGTLIVDDADVFAVAELEGRVVYALGTHGHGRFIATADSSLPLQEHTDCPLRRWLAGRDEIDPPLLRFGFVDTDLPEDVDYPGAVTAGIHLPAEYVGDPARLAEDFAIVWYLEEAQILDQGDEPSDAEVQTLIDFAAIHGGGLIVSSEYSVSPVGGYLGAADIASVNRIMQPLGIEAEAVSLEWGDADGSIEFPCFPPPG